MKKKLPVLFGVAVLLISLFLAFSHTHSYADDSASSSATTTQSEQSLQQEISDLQGKISGLQGQEQTLSSQIDVMDNQQKLTELRIQSTQQQINDLQNDIATANDKISSLNGSLTTISEVLIQRIRKSYIAGNIQPFEIMLSSDNADDFVQRENYLKLVADHDRQLAFSAQQAKVDYATEKQIFQDKKNKIEDLKTELVSYTSQLDQEKTNKQNLLSQTQGDEATYQRLLAQAQAQLAGFSRFVTSQGGASLLSGQTVCNDWGCYYNQRDSQWGGLALNGTQYSIASDGCLLTDMAMVMTHYGYKNVTPISINSDPRNFASYEPAWLNRTIYAAGASASRISSSIDSELSAGNPVIVGISYDSGPLPDHFVTLISGSNGVYQMNDPYLANGNNISFNAHYSMGSIREIDRVVVN